MDKPKKTKEEIESYVRKAHEDAPNGLYQIGPGCWTGKEGYIKYQIELEVLMQEMAGNLTIQ